VSASDRLHVDALMLEWNQAVYGKCNGGAETVVGQVTAVSGTDGKFVLRGLTTGRLNLDVSWQMSPGQQVQVSSIRLGERDVLKNGLDVPYQGTEKLRITIDCANGRRAQ